MVMPHITLYPQRNTKKEKKSHEIVLVADLGREAVIVKNKIKKLKKIYLRWTEIE